MPLFCLVSGYLTRKKEFLPFWKGIVSVAKPLVIFQIIFIVSVYNSEKLTIVDFFVPYWILWYLMSLIFWRSIVQFSPKVLLDRPCLFFVISVIFSVLSGLMQFGMILSIQRTLYFFPFFLYGYYQRPNIFPTITHKTTSSIILCISVLLLILYPLPDHLSGYLKGTYHSCFHDLPMKAGILAFSFMFSLSVFSVINGSRWLSVIGKDSMFFYIYHAIVLKFSLFIIIKHYHLPSSFLFMIFYFTLVLLVLFAMRRFSVFRWLLNPSFKPNAYNGTSSP